jgi:hypothetical protein
VLTWSRAVRGLVEVVACPFVALKHTVWRRLLLYCAREQALRVAFSPDFSNTVTSPLSVWLMLLLIEINEAVFGFAVFVVVVLQLPLDSSLSSKPFITKNVMMFMVVLFFQVFLTL